VAGAGHDLEGRALALDGHPGDPGGAEIVHGHPLARRIVAALVELAAHDAGVEEIASEEGGELALVAEAAATGPRPADRGGLPPNRAAVHRGVEPLDDALEIAAGDGGDRLAAKDRQNMRLDVRADGLLALALLAARVEPTLEPVLDEFALARAGVVRADGELGEGSATALSRSLGSVSGGSIGTRRSRPLMVRRAFQRPPSNRTEPVG
jgi:hypothetical protein